MVVILGLNDRHIDLIEEGSLGSYVHQGFWWEFGTPELYLNGSLALIDLEDQRREKIAHCDPVKRIGSALAAIGEGVQLHATSRLQGRVALGAFSRIDQSASLEDSILMPGASVGAGCRLRRAVLAPGVRLQAGAALEENLLCSSEDGEEAT